MRTRRIDPASEQGLTGLAKTVVGLLKQRGLKIVLAESCTGGLVSALLTRIPGVSQFHCGSAVVYQVSTKATWLGISKDVLQKPGPVSRVVASEMVTGVLSITPHADIGAAVTGHLGPDAPKSQDGVVYLATARRTSGSQFTPPKVTKINLSKEPDDSSTVVSRRRFRRQRSAAGHLLLVLIKELSKLDGS